MSRYARGVLDRSVLDRLEAERLSLELAEEALERSEQMRRSGATSVPVGPMTSLAMDEADFGDDVRHGTAYGRSVVSGNLSESSDTYDVSCLPF